METLRASEKPVSLSPLRNAAALFSAPLGCPPLRNAITGNGADNRLSGGEGVDTLIGGRGSDTLIGGHGADMLTGGSGVDVFIADSLERLDRIADFSAAEREKIDVSSLDANVATPGNQAFQFVGSAAFSANATGQIRYDYDAKSGIGTLSGSTDADAMERPDRAIPLAENEADDDGVGPITGLVP